MISHTGLRVFTAVGLLVFWGAWMVVLPAIWAALTGLLVLLGLAWEWNRLLGLPNWSWLGLLLFLVLWVSWHFAMSTTMMILFLMSVLMALLAHRMSLPLPAVWKALQWVLGVTSVGMAVWLLREHDHGLLITLTAWIAAADSGAYFAGRRWGRRPLAPTISSGKTWEGLLGGCVCAALVGGLMGWPYGWVQWGVLGGVGLTVVALLGDLFESVLKRQAGVKDSGSLLPGHGGLFDRLDSWVVAAPVVWVCWHGLAG